ncbi:hypothetical protein ACWDA3_06260 [Nonomuraea rubra]
MTYSSEEFRVACFTQAAKKHRFLQDFVDFGIEQGRVSGWKQAILLVLRERGVLSAFGNDLRISECDDPETLERWIKKATVVANVDELFD